MFRSGEVRVITAEAREDGKSTKLKDLIADPVWDEAVGASPLVEHYLSAMPYEEFIAAEGSRVLSYRSGNVAKLDCVVADPAGAMERTAGAMPLSLLATPTEGWTHLWIDALNHLNDPASVAETVKSSGDLYLAVPTLPQFWLGGDYDAALAAMSRGWVHQELSYGRLDRAALEKFVGMCCARYAEQTHGKEWKGNVADLEGPKLLTRLIGKRIKAAAAHAPSAQAACEWYGRVNKVKDVPTMVTADVASDEECAASLAALYDALEQKQLSDSAADNLAALGADASLAWSVVKSYANSHVHDKSDMYVSSLGALGAACGVAVADPLGAYKAKFFKKGGKPTANDGTLHYTHADVDLQVLNANHALLQACWGALLPMESFGDIPAAVKGVGPTDKAMVDWSAYPPGVATLGLGPAPVSGLKDGKMKFGKFFGVDFTAEGPPPADGYYSRGELKGIEGEGTESLELPPEGSVPGAYARESFGKDFAGFHPMCKWNVSMAEVEAKMKADEEFVRTLENLWAAWLKDYDTDGSKTISLEELMKFAELTECPSSDGYMQSLHDWASGALTDGSLESSFKEVDTDGSGELEFGEFKQMLWEDQ